MKSIVFCILAMLLAVSVDAKDPDCPGPEYHGDPVTFPDLFDCQLYYQCENGEKVHMTCGYGMLWNERINHCDDHLHATCDHTYPTAIPTATPPPVTDSDGKDEDCPGPEYHGDPVTFPDLFDCQLFYQCENGQKVHMTCGYGMLWNERINHCDDHLHADCAHTYPTALPTRPTDEPESADATTYWPTYAPLGSLCKGVRDGDYVILPNECYRYVQCEDGKELYINCPDGLYFDKATMYCSSGWSNQC